MKIAIDLRVSRSSRGIARYANNLVTNIAKLDKENQYYCFLEKEFSESILPSNWEQIILPHNSTFIDHFFFFEKNLRSVKPDLFFHPDNREFINMPIPSVVTIHDLTPVLFPEFVFSSDPLLNARQRIYYWMQKQAIKRNTDRIITVSENTRNDVLRYLNFKEDKVISIHEGIESRFSPVKNIGKLKEIKVKYKLSEKFIFYIGGFGKHKNVTGLIYSFGQIANKFSDVNLVLGGKTVTDDTSGQNEYHNLHQMVKRLDLEERVLFPGFIADEDLAGVYSLAAVFVYPSLYEGFGFPPLEAMASGCPVISSIGGSLAEVVGSGGILINPNDKAELAQAISLVLGDSKKRAALVSKGLARAKVFQWEKTAKETLAVFNTFSTI